MTNEQIKSHNSELRKWLAIMVDNIKDGNHFNNDELTLWAEKAEAELSNWEGKTSDLAKSLSLMSQTTLSKVIERNKNKQP